MRVITANMLSGLAGVDLALIAKVVELINHPELTSLNGLREGLANGTWTIRVGERSYEE
jgi:hypothetical protein